MEKQLRPMYCKRCGKEIPDDALFCGYCRTPVDQPQKEKQETTPEPIQQTDKKPVRKQKKKHRGLLWLLLIPVVLVGSLIAAIIISTPPSQIVVNNNKQSGMRDLLENEASIPEKRSGDSAEKTEKKQEETVTESKQEAEKPANTEDRPVEPVAEDEIVPDEPAPKDELIRRIRVVASSTSNAKSTDGQTYEADHLIDGDYTTAWLEGRDDEGIGESLTFTFDGKHRIFKIKIYNGFLNTKYRYTINGKVTKLLAEFDDGSSQIINLNVMQVSNEKVPFTLEEMNPTVVVFDQPIETETMKLTILDAVAGTKYKDICMSEIEVYE